MDIKKFLYNGLMVVLILCGVGIVVYELCFSEEIDGKLLSKAVLLSAFSAFVLISRVRLKSKSSKKLESMFTEEFGDCMDSAFISGKASKRKLKSAAASYFKDNPKKALHTLDGLYDKCDTSNDYCAVLVLRGFCYLALGRPEEAEEEFQSALNYNDNQPKIWLRLAVIYHNKNDLEKYAQYNENCLKYEENPVAYSNLAYYYMRKAEYNKAREYALKAIEIDPSVYQAMSTAAGVACLEGDMEECRKFTQMYVANGGSADKIREYIDGLKKVGK